METNRMRQASLVLNSDSLEALGVAEQQSDTVVSWRTRVCWEATINDENTPCSI